MSHMRNVSAAVLVAGLLAGLLAPASAASGPQARSRPADPTSQWPGRAGYSVPTSTMDKAISCIDRIEDGDLVRGRPDGTGMAEPVLLVHGSFVNERINWEWNYARSLPPEGFEVCWVRLPDSAYGDIQISSEYVARAVELIHRWTKERVDVLGHSQGGLEPRWAIKYFPSGRFIDDYVALAAPNHGTVIADAEIAAGHSCGACWQMATGSDLLAALNAGDETPGRVSYTSIYTTFDQMVQPVGTQALEGGTNILLQDLCPGRPVDHVGIAGDAVAYLLTLDALIEPGPADVESLPSDVCQRTVMPGLTAPPADGDLNPPRDYEDHTEEPPLMPYAVRS
ncbi:MAG TPA: lipase [Actinomycetota bacterium]|nr:lipase [Actinomycetota bacterium]